MIRLTLGLIIAAFLWGAAAPPAHPQALCGERSALVERLEREFSETPQALGLSEDGALVEIMVSPSGGWTILVTYPKRPSCVVATGEGWESLLVPVPAGQPA